MENKIGILNYDSSNLISLSKCLETLKLNYIVSKNIKRLSSCTVLILQGVGTYENVMNFLIKYKLDNFIKNFSKNKSKKIIGICIGMQILSNKGNEAHDGRYINGLGLIDGQTTKLDNFHIGWNKVRIDNFLNKQFNNKYFFFNHSYAFKNTKEKILCGSFFFNHSRIPAIIKYQNIFGFQFHPEKSHNIGLKFLEKIINYEN